jgi:SAM-dependent methyltransferase
MEEPKRSHENYLEINRSAWNKKVDVHLNSDFYAVNDFIKGETSLNSIELNLLGDVRHKKLLHLQCHFGQDSISLSRIGATVTGIDLSDKAIQEAEELVKKCNTNARFVCCDVYDVNNQIKEKFDIVFSSYGTIGWLPDLNKWAQVISEALKPGGEFVFVEFHPVVWMFDDNFERIAYSYFNSGPIIETYSGSYADKNAPIQNELVMWNHSLADVIQNLIQHGLEITSFSEFDYSPYNCFNETVEVEFKKFRIKHLGNNIPMVYALKAKKRL